MEKLGLTKLFSHSPSSGGRIYTVNSLGVEYMEWIPRGNKATEISFAKVYSNRAWETTTTFANPDMAAS